MWFKRSSVQLSAAVVLALTTKDYTTAGVFFTLGIFERMEEERIEQVERRVDRIANNDIKLLLDQINIVDHHVNRDRVNLQNDVHRINTKLREVVKSIKNLD